METLKFKTTQFQDPDNEILLEMIGDRLHIVYGKLFDQIEVERLLSPKETRHELARLDDLHIENWQDHYEGHDQIVDTKWSVELDGHFYEGNAGYPKNWEYFLQVIHDLVPEAGLADPDEVIYLEVVTHNTTMINKLTVHVQDAHIDYTCKENGRIITMFEIRDRHLAKELLETVTVHDHHVVLGKLNHQNHYVAVELASKETLVYDYRILRMRNHPFSFA